MPYIGNQHNVGDHVNNFKVLDDISSHTATFDGSATSVVSAADDTIRIPEHRFIQGQRVTYTNGGGGNIGGLTSGTAYFISFDTANTIKLATTLANANSNTVINLSAVGSGTSHTLNAAFDGVNTKFKVTYSNGKAARFNNATQLNVAINNVVQRPNINSVSFTEGFAIEDNHKIVFKTAPIVNDVFWGSIIANTIENFDLRDNEVDNFTGDGSTTEFTLSTIPANNESVMVSLDGVLQHPSDKNTARSYTLLDSIIQFTAAPGNGVEIQVRHIGFAGATTNDVSGFYGRTGNVTLTDQDDIIVNKISVGTGATIESNGQATFVGVVTFGSSSTTIEGDNNLIKVGTALTLGHTQGLQFHTQNLHSTGFEVNNINASGIITASSFVGNIGGNPTFSGDTTFNGSVSIGGTLTYEDVTNIDSVGIITARNGIKDQTLTAGHVVFAGTAGRLSGEAELFYNSSNNRLGIGTNNPSHELDIESSSPVIELKDNDAGDSRLQIAQSGAQTFLDMDKGGLGSSSLRFRFAGEERVRFTTAGLVGIGTQNPSALLHLHKASGDAIQKIESSNGAASLELRHTNGYGYINYRQDGAETFRVGQIAQFTSYSVYNPNSSLPYQLCVEGNGEVGINTHNPGDTLHLLRNSANHGIRLQRAGTNPGTAYVQVHSNGVLSLQGGNNIHYVSGGSQQHIWYRAGTELGKFNVSGNFNLNYDLDVDGHTNLDNVSIAGITTFSGQGIHIENAINPFIHLKDTTNNTDSYVSTDNAGSLYLKADDNQEGSSTKIVFQVDGSEKVHIDSGGSVRIANTNFSAAGNADELILGTTSGNRGLTIVSGNTGIGALFFADDGSTNIGSLVYEHNTNQMRMVVNGSQVMRLDYTSVPTWIYGSDTNTYTSLPASDTIAFTTGGTERLRIDSSGRLLYGKTSSTRETSLVIVGNSNSYATNPGTIQLEMGNTPSNLASLGQIQFGSQDKVGATISVRADQDWNINSAHGTHVRFMTTANGSASNPTERLRIASDGEIFMGANFGATNRSTLLSISGANQDPAGVWTQVGIYADGGQAVDKGGSIGFGGPDGSNSQQQFSAIKGAKENSTSGNYAGYMAFYTRPAGAVSGERLRITSGGNLKMPDNLKIELGGAQTGSGDFYLNFDGTYATMHSGGNQMNIRSNRIQLGDNGGVLYIDCTDNSTVKLYHQSGGVATEKLATAAFGIDIPDTLRLSNGYADTGSQMCLGADSSGNCTIAGYNLQIATGNNSSRVNRFLFSHTAFYPAADNTYDLGVYNYRWKDLYVGDAHFSNRDSKNEVDGTWGDWTLQEGESKIFMINNRTGKKYSLKMEEE